MRTSYWLRQPTWVINPSTGNDSATGVDAGHPIRSHAELARRWSMQAGVAKLDQATTVTYTGALPAGDVVAYNINFGESGLLQVFGSPTSPASGTFTGVTAINRGTQTFQAVTDSALVGGFAPYVGTHMLRIVGGPRAGSTAWVAKDLGGGACRTSRWVKPNLTTTQPIFASMDPQVGDAYQVLLPTQLTVSGVQVQAYADSVPVQSTKLLTFTDVNMLAAIQETLFSGTGSGYMKFFNCEFQNLRMGSILSHWHGCNLLSLRAMAGTHLVKYAGLTQATGIFLGNGSYMRCDLDDLYQGNAFVNIEGHMEIATSAFFDATSAAPLGVTGPTGRLKSQGTGGAEGVDLIWGTNNAGRGLTMTGGAEMTFQTRPTINGGLGLNRELRLGDVDYLWTDVPVRNMRTGDACNERRT